MRKVYFALTVVVLTAMVFTQVSCKWGGPLANGMAGIQIGVASPGTRVYLDGRSIGTVGTGPGPIAYVAPGEHKLTAKAPGYEPYEMSVYGYAGSTVPYNLPLLGEMTPTPKKK